MQIGLRLACNAYAAQAGFPSVETILARAGITRFSSLTEWVGIHKPKAHPLFFAAKRED